MTFYNNLQGGSLNMCNQLLALVKIKRLVYKKY